MSLQPAWETSPRWIFPHICVLEYGAKPQITIQETPEGDGWVGDQQAHRESEPGSDGVAGDLLNFMQMVKHNSKESSMKALWQWDL